MQQCKCACGFIGSGGLRLCKNKQILNTCVQQVCGMYSEGAWFDFPQRIGYTKNFSGFP